MTNPTPQFPLSNAAYDIIVILHEKSKALQAYENYLTDVQDDTSLRQALVEIRNDEQKHIDMLKAHLPRLMSNPSTASDEGKTIIVGD
jgi:rubrerythrin